MLQELQAAHHCQTGTLQMTSVLWHDSAPPALQVDPVEQALQEPLERANPGLQEVQAAGEEGQAAQLTSAHEEAAQTPLCATKPDTQNAQAVEEHV